MKDQMLETGKVKTLLEQMKRAGTVVVSLSGGEPTLHEGIHEIVEYCAELNMVPELNSNGFRLPDMIGELNNLHLLKLSVDGPENVHDLQAGKPGSYKIAVAAIEAAKSANIRTSIVTVLTRHNIRYIKDVLDIASYYDITAVFLTLKNIYRGIEDVSDIAPKQDEYSDAINALIVEKTRGNDHIRNTLEGLKHIERWPEYNEMPCAAGKLFCVIDVDGTMVACDRTDCDHPRPDALKLGFSEAFNTLPPVNCSGCGFYGANELSFMLRRRLSFSKAYHRWSEKNY